MPVVVHCAESFVAVTENWIYHQVVGTSRYRPVVATERRENADQFPFSEVIYPDEKSGMWRVESGKWRVRPPYFPSTRFAGTRAFHFSLPHRLAVPLQAL